MKSAGPKVYLLGDLAYKGIPYVLTPFSNPSGAAEKYYNIVQRATRGRAEHVFGYWKKSFPILNHLPNIQVERLPGIIMATAVLYNIKQMSRPDFMTISPADISLYQQETADIKQTTGQTDVRDYLVNTYFRKNARIMVSIYLSIYICIYLSI